MTNNTIEGPDMTAWTSDRKAAWAQAAEDNKIKSRIIVPIGLEVAETQFNKQRKLAYQYYAEAHDHPTHYNISCARGALEGAAGYARTVEEYLDARLRIVRLNELDEVEEEPEDSEND